jgi:hypothetical protein
MMFALFERLLSRAETKLRAEVNKTNTEMTILIEISTQLFFFALESTLNSRKNLEPDVFLIRSNGAKKFPLSATLKLIVAHLNHVKDSKQLERSHSMAAPAARTGLSAHNFVDRVIIAT